MKRLSRIALLAIAVATPIHSQATRKQPELLSFTLTETPKQLIELLGRPDRIDDSAPQYQSWQYDFPAGEASDENTPPAWLVCLQADNQQILSVTRNFVQPQSVASLFPAGEIEVHQWPSRDAPRFSLLLRTLGKDTLLLAMGTGERDGSTTQLVLIRRSALKRFMPWLAEQLQQP